MEILWCANYRVLCCIVCAQILICPISSSPQYNGRRNVRFITVTAAFKCRPITNTRRSFAGQIGVCMQRTLSERDKRDILDS